MWRQWKPCGLDLSHNCSQHGLRCLNVKKTKYILFRPNVTVPKSNTNCIMLNGQKVVQIGHKLNEKSFKFLGIHIDETLSWKYQINSVCARIANSNYMINKVKHVLPKSTLFTLYSALVHSHINYGLLIWGSSPLILQSAWKSTHKYHKRQRSDI